MKIFEVKQGSDEWRAIRKGKVTGTRLKDVMKADNLSVIDEVIAERISDEIEENYTNDAMRRGTEMEPVARKEYEKQTGFKVTEFGFCGSNEFPLLGLSPDGLIEENKKWIKGLEIKCPNTATHVRYIRMNKIPNEYKYQIYNYFLVCQDMESLDFVSYDDRFQTKPIHIITVKREEILTELEMCRAELTKFFAKLEKYYNEIIFG